MFLSKSHIVNKQISFQNKFTNQLNKFKIINFLNNQINLN